ncbi:MAG: DNA polymerase III subunit beta, partial [Halochromatium sp.]|nr:DNA polymerase III subunit beta [Halochromatium sp.]
MRLNAHQRETIKQAARGCFGADATVRLFGSRVDDHKRGGDIDLFITTS